MLALLVASGSPSAVWPLRPLRTMREHSASFASLCLCMPVKDDVAASPGALNISLRIVAQLALYVDATKTIRAAKRGHHALHSASERQLLLLGLASAVRLSSSRFKWPLRATMTATEHHCYAHRCDISEQDCHTAVEHGFCGRKENCIHTHTLLQSMCFCQLSM